MYFKFLEQIDLMEAEISKVKVTKQELKIKYSNQNSFIHTWHVTLKVRQS